MQKTSLQSCQISQSTERTLWSPLFMHFLGLFSFAICPSGTNVTVKVLGPGPSLYSGLAAFPELLSLLVFLSLDPS